jgi:hypothetical protein
MASSALVSTAVVVEEGHGALGAGVGSTTTVSSGARPRAPGGVSGVRCTVAPPSVEP